MKEEANRKYANLVESIPLRLEQLIKSKKLVEAKVDDEDNIGDWKLSGTNYFFLQFAQIFVFWNFSSFFADNKKFHV